LPNEAQLEKLNCEWAVPVYPMRMRDFIFKFRSNLLGLNTRVSHFNQNISRGCTFCTAARRDRAEPGVIPPPPPPPGVPFQVPIPPAPDPDPVPNIGPIPDESFEHLFFNCTITESALTGFFDKYFNEGHFPNILSKKKFLFTGTNWDTDIIDNFFLSTVAVILMFYIWECKLRKRLPTTEGMANDLFYNMENIRRASSTLRMHMAKVNNLLLCRIWTAEVSRRR
jgi:hypothetical protein